jgi:hypothetical protein
MLFLLFILATLLSPCVSLVCSFGTAAELNQTAVPLNCTVNALLGQDSCISAIFQTPLVAGAGTAVYTCGNCSVFQTMGSTPGSSVSNVTCCSSGDLCQTISPPPPVASCESMITQSSCIALSECYWCGSSIFGMGICQNYTGFTFPGTGVPQLPAFALNLVVPPPVCSFVDFQQFQPAYTVNNLTLAYLTSYGFYPIYRMKRDIYVMKLIYLSQSYDGCWYQSGRIIQIYKY